MGTTQSTKDWRPKCSAKTRLSYKFGACLNKDCKNRIKQEENSSICVNDDCVGFSKYQPINKLGDSE